MSSSQPDVSGRSDITDCDREPIHIPGRIQAFGCLIGVTSDWIISHVSENAAEVLKLDNELKPGLPLSEVLPGQVIHDIRSRLQMLSSPDAVERIFGLVLNEQGTSFDTAVHMSGKTIIMEFEPEQTDANRDYTGYIRPMLDRVNRATSIPQLHDVAARQIKAITGMDRVMVYRFAQDGTGEVIAEARESDMESFLNLRYPATDIPQQARALYVRNLLRIISDVNDPGHAVVPTLDPQGDPLDLSMSATRAVSPIHLEYLRNMGVGASMSISILYRGKLWGLFACHHRTSMVLSYRLRSALELFAQLFAYALDQKLSSIRAEQETRSRILHDQIMARIVPGSSIESNLDVIVDAARPVIAFDGVVGIFDGSIQIEGLAPGREELSELVDFLNTAAAGHVYGTDCLSRHHRAAEAYADRTAGILVLPVSRKPRDYIVFCRQEIARTVTWAGNPDKAVKGGDGKRLTPRQSFAAWQEIVRNHSESWSDSEIRTADALRISLLEVVLRTADARLAERAKSQDQQEILIAELNHRVKNILNLVKGLVNQTGAEADDISNFTETIGGRVHALARAHDQITQKNWSPASLQKLIVAESEAYVNSFVDRIRIEGPDVLLEPEAFTTLSLVVHELMTNSMKYGSLTDQRGSVDINVVPGSGNAVSITWKEVDGPPVKEPSRRGFGSTIIERSVPFDLKGTAQVDYLESGMVAVFDIPGNHVAGFEHRTPEAQEEKQKPVESVQALDVGSVLIVEDNMIIAMDAEDLVRRLGGSEVHLAASVSQALSVLTENMIDLAFLDIDLGDETSAEVAEVLQEREIPFAFTSGFGHQDPVTQRFPDAPVVNKPYEKDDIARTIAILKGATQ